MLTLIEKLERFCKDHGIVLVYNFDDQHEKVMMRFSDNEGERSFALCYPQIIDPDITFDNTVKRLVDHFELESDCDNTESHGSITAVEGLGKSEYIALELTKAWSATRSKDYYTINQIVEAYKTFLKEIEEM